MYSLPAYSHRVWPALAMVQADLSSSAHADCPLPIRRASWVKRHFPGLCALGRSLGWTLIALYLLFALTILALRHLVLPQIQEYRPQIERLFSRAIGLPVGIAKLQARWDGLRPGLVIGELTIHDRQDQPALSLRQVEAVLSWHTLWRWQPVLHHLEVRAPDLAIRRDAAGQIFVAGLPVGASSGKDDFSDWLLAQEQVIIRDARISWLDEQRGAPLLTLSALNLRLENRGRQHRFGLTALPSPELAARLDLRGDFRGRDLENLQAWYGRAWLELDYADLAIWRQWIDYPLELPRGRGALRLWADFADERMQGVTADLRLADVALRLAPELPMLELHQLAGRLSVKLRGSNGWLLDGQQLAFSLGEEGLHQPVTDLRCDWWPESGGSRGEFSATHLDLATLAALAAALPLDVGLRERLAASAPHGALTDLAFNWRHKAGEPLRWSIASHFAGLALAPYDGLPGVALLDGELRGDQRAGRLLLHAGPFALKLPEVFPQGGLAFDRLAGEVRWRHEADHRWIVQLLRLEFANADLAGSARGRWLSTAAGPGRLELEAKIPQLQGAAIWRYLPYAVNQDARDWLRQALLAGVAEQVTLKLAGDLAYFPFHDARQGIFRVHGRLRDGRLRYAPDWPELSGVAGELTFDGVGMRLRGERGQILGTQVKEVLAEIPNLDTPAPWLKLSGKVSGEANEFLRFIGHSPVAERIDHFTAGMSVTGQSELALKLDMPLANVAATRINGRFRFMGNRLTLANDLPPLIDTQGELIFTGEKLEVKKGRARFLGLPLFIEVATQPGGVIKAKASGTLDIAPLAAQLPHPVFQHLSGSAPLSAQLTVNKKAVDLRVESTLHGISSSLPEPFNKSAASILPLVFERRSLGSGAVARERLNLTLGEVLALQLQRRLDGQQATLERGLIALGRTAASRLGEMPDKGLRLSAWLNQLDVDFWRRLAQEANGGGGLPLDRLDVRADELKLLGRRLHGLTLKGQREGERWRFDLDSREAVGRLAWMPAGKGWLEARFSLLTIPEGEEGGGNETAKVSPTDTPQELPAVLLSADRFRLGVRELGALKVEGVNRDGAWHGQAELSNDEADLTAKGRWRPEPADFRMQFTLRTNSIEKLLSRLGLANTVRRGSSTLEGELGWAGSPLAFDLATMQGTLKLSAANGQFAKLEPGVGRLLGVLSLQALPRRITLDFRDIFSEGLTFDAIEGRVHLGNGRIATQDLAIRGPQARIAISGEADLVHETQDLRVRVQPVIGDSVATGVMLMVNPAAGAAVWLADRLLQDPLGRALAWEFAVSGPWQEPKVDKITAPRPSGKAEAAQ